MTAPLPANLDREIACAWNDESPVLGSLLAQRSGLQEAADPALKVRRLRQKALDARATYQRHMDAYGDAIGRSQDRWNRGELDLSKSFAREAVSCLACATDCLIEAERIEREADKLARFVTLFDGVSARLEAAE
jgi:hypothetical protein